MPASATADRSPGAVVSTAGMPLAPEDQARADFYALLSRLYGDAPDAALLAAIASAPPLGDTAGIDDADAAAPNLPEAWERLRAASATADPAAIVEEYNELFIGVGKSEVNLHASHWLTGFMMEKPLVEVRTSLAGLGLSRRADVTLLEDHLSALFETMRILVAGQGDRAPVPVADQRAFFERHIAPWALLCCAAIRACPVANYYCHVAQFTNAYVAIERDSFAID